MTGGTGNDVYVVDNAGDVLFEAAGEGTDTVEALVDFTLADGFEVLTLIAPGLKGTGNEWCEPPEMALLATTICAGAAVAMMFVGAMATTCWKVALAMTATA